MSEMWSPLRRTGNAGRPRIGGAFMIAERPRLGDMRRYHVILSDREGHYRSVQIGAWSPQEAAELVDRQGLAVHVIDRGPVIAGRRGR